MWLLEQNRDKAYDYALVGIFSTKEKAESVANVLGEELDITEWEVDPGLNELAQGLSIFEVVMEFDGSVRRLEKLPLDVNSFLKVQNPASLTHAIYQTVWAKDEAEAIQKVNASRVEGLTWQQP